LSSEQKTLESTDTKNDSVEKTLLPEDIPEAWRITKVEELIDRVRSRVDPEEMSEQNYVSLKHMGKGKPRINEVDNAKDVSSQKYAFEKKDILFGKLRPYFRKVALAKFDGICSTDINVIRPTDKVDRDFLFYTLFRQDFIDMADKTSTGTRMPRADWSKLNELEIALPTIEEQEKISSALYSLDEKIETNNRVNEILEGMAQTLFKAWFVDFEPYEEFKDSELGEIPEDFEVMNLVDIADVTYGYSFSSEKFNEEGEGMPVIRIRNLPDNETDKYSPEDFKEKYIINPGDVLAGMDGEFRPHIWKGPKSGLNQRVCKFEGKEPLYSDIYLWNVVRKPLYKLEKSKTGTTVIHLGKKDIDQIKIAVPDKDSLRKFNEILEPFYQEMIKREQENKKLEEMRDVLLPKLMSGEIRVNVDGDE